MSDLTSHLRSLKPAELLEWLRQALSSKLDLPQITQDEPPAVSLARLTTELSGIVLANFEKACLKLTHEFAREPHWSESDYERQLLSLVGSLRLTEASLPLEKLAKVFPNHLRIEARQHVLHAIHDIGRRHDAAFWKKIAEQKPADFGGIALSALLRLRHQTEALDVLAVLPDQQEIAGVAASLLQLAFRKITAENQNGFLGDTAKRLDLCKPAVRQALSKWLEARGYQRPRMRSRISPSLSNRFSFDPGPAKLCHRNLEPAYA